MDPIESMANDVSATQALLIDKGEPSLSASVGRSLIKAVLLASASYFENEIIALVREYVGSRTICDKVQALVARKALSRQYHTFFDWDTGTNANTFFALFGDKFKEKFKSVVRNDPILESSIRDFLEIGRERNRLVHQNFASYSLEKTVDELISLHGRAKRFIESFRAELFFEDGAEVPVVSS